MGKDVGFYKIGIERDGQLTTLEPMDWFLVIDQRQRAGQNVERLIRGKRMRLFSYYWGLSDSVVVIPFGKSKDNNPFQVVGNDLKSVDAKLVDINSLYYNRMEGIGMITTNREGPNHQDIEEYLNSFRPADVQWAFRVRPLLVVTGYEKLRNAELVRSLTLRFDLGGDINAFYLREQTVSRRQDQRLLDNLKSLLSEGEEQIKGRGLEITFNVGRGSHTESLRLDSVLSLLEQINIDASCVTEISAHYKDSSSEKVELARLKNQSIMLRTSVRGNHRQISPELLLHNSEDLLEARRNTYMPALREYRRNPVAMLPEDWMRGEEDEDELESDNLEDGKRTALAGI